jgi:hypothetical protein
LFRSCQPFVDSSIACVTKASLFACESIIYIPLTIILTRDGGMLLAIGIIIALISIFITFLGTFASASLSDFTINIPLENATDDQNSTNTPEVEPPQGLTPSESLTLRGLSPQGADDLAVACSLLPERC